ncbi:MAG TPA: protein-ADP-ribose hydrolase [Candidatus Lokiarchaeia archaeon]|nr:protein-ADP-ribose hydrolase [Candidatus Lokiarchaeia archaeon]
MELDDYRALISLDVPFSRSMVTVEEAMDMNFRQAIVTELIGYFEQEKGQNFVRGSIHDEPRKKLYTILIARPPCPFPEWVNAKLDMLLQAELQSRSIQDASALPRIDEIFPTTTYDSAGSCALWQGDITCLDADAIVNAANDRLLGCFIPFHACIDNAIHAAAGSRVREDCNTIMEQQGFPEPTGLAKITRAYNLPSRFILHTVGPVYSSTSSILAGEQLALCYRSCLDLASQLPAIRSIAFCSISTGVFGFPKQEAARIALAEVGRWLQDHPGRMDVIVFNVFSTGDLQPYQALLE